MTEGFSLVRGDNITSEENPIIVRRINLQKIQEQTILKHVVGKDKWDL